MKNKLTLFATVFIIGGFIVLGYFMLQPSESPEPLPVINPINVDEGMVSSELQGIGYGHRVGKFSFIDQYNQPVSHTVVKGRIWVAEYFFTTCKDICPVMNQQMQKVQRAFKGDDSVKILSFTVDPTNDTPEKLYQYAVNHHAQKGQWYFLTGEKDSLYQFARKSIFVLKPAEAANLGDAGSDFIHTNNFVLIDRVGRIRGYYDGTKSDKVQQLVKDIQLLKKEKADA